MGPAVDGRREKQARRTDEQAGDRVERRQSLERDAGAAFDRDQHGRRDERPAGKRNRKRRERERERPPRDELIDSGLGDGQRAHRHEETERYVVGVR